MKKQDRNVRYLEKRTFLLWFLLCLPLFAFIRIKFNIPSFYDVLNRAKEVSRGNEARIQVIEQMCLNNNEGIAARKVLVEENKNMGVMLNTTYEKSILLVNEILEMRSSFLLLENEMTELRSELEAWKKKDCENDIEKLNHTYKVYFSQMKDEIESLLQQRKTQLKANEQLESEIEELKLLKRYNPPPSQSDPFQTIQKESMPMFHTAPSLIEYSDQEIVSRNVESFKNTQQHSAVDSGSKEALAEKKPLICEGKHYVFNSNRVGAAYKEMSSTSARDCKFLCEQDKHINNCAVWVYSKVEVSCRLFNSYFPASDDNCCISGALC